MAHDGIAGAAPASLPDRSSSQRWLRLPIRQLPGGGRAGRLAMRFDDQGGGFLALVIAAKANRFALTFQVVEPRPVMAGEHDPRLGQVLIDGRTVRFGLVETLWRSATRTTLTTFTARQYDGLFPALLCGQDLVLRTNGRSFDVRLDNLRGPLADALRAVVDPQQLPLARWLSE
jgi:hypothetical protein